MYRQLILFCEGIITLLTYIFIMSNTCKLLHKNYSTSVQRINIIPIAIYIFRLIKQLSAITYNKEFIDSVSIFLRW